MLLLPLGPRDAVSNWCGWRDISLLTDHEARNQWGTPVDMVAKSMAAGTSTKAKQIAQFHATALIVRLRLLAYEVAALVSALKFLPCSRTVFLVFVETHLLWR